MLAQKKAHSGSLQGKQAAERVSLLVDRHEYQVDTKRKKQSSLLTPSKRMSSLKKAPQVHSKLRAKEAGIVRSIIIPESSIPKSMSGGFTLPSGATKEQYSKTFHSNLLKKGSFTESQADAGSSHSSQVK